MSTSNLTVSLEPHLSESLQSIKENLPDDVRKELVQELSQTEVHYSLLLRISQWARTEAGTKALKTTNLQSGDLQMVSLLAGTRTSPSSKLPPYIPPESDELRMQRESDERRALAFVINGFLSVICAGGSTWWAANKAGWKPEWVCSRLHFRHLARDEVNSEHIIEKKTDSSPRTCRWFCRRLIGIGPLHYMAKSDFPVSEVSQESRVARGQEARGFRRR